MGLELPGDQVTNHCFQPHGLPRKTKPHEPQLLYMGLGQGGWDPPLRRRYIRHRVVGDDDIEGPPVIEPGLLSGLSASVVRHQGQVLGDLCLLLS